MESTRTNGDDETSATDPGAASPALHLAGGGPAAIRPTLEREIAIDLIEALIDDPDVQSLLDHAAQLISSAVGGDAVVVSLLSQDGAWLEQTGVCAPETEQEVELRRLLDARVRVGENASTKVLLTGQPMVLWAIDPIDYRAGAIPRFRHYFERWPAFGTVAVPIVADGAPIGLVLTMRHRGDDPYDDDTASWLGIAAARLGPALIGPTTRPASTRAQDLREMAHGPIGLIAAVLIPILVTVIVSLTSEPTVYLPTVVLLTPVVIIAAIAGTRAGIVATITSSLLLWWALFPPRRSFALEDSSFTVGLLAFIASCTIVCLVIDRLDRSGHEEMDAERLDAASRQDELTRRLQVAERHALADSRFRSLVEATSSLTWLADGAGELVTPQSAWETYTGQPWLADLASGAAATGHAGSGWLEMIHPDDRRHVIDAWRAARDLGVVFEASARLWSATHQEYRHAVFRSAPIKDRHGVVVEWIGTTTDVHDSYRLAQELNQTQAQLSVMMEANVLAFIFGDEDIVTDANDAFLHLTDHTRDELEHRRLNWRELTPPGWESADEGAMDQLLREGRADPFEKEYLRRDGTHIPVEVGVVALDRAPLKWAAYVVDLTDRKAAERQLREAYQQRDHVARVLQTSLLPPTLPDPPGLRLAARYLPSPVGEGVGGDFYDVFQDHEGAWHMFIGDVCGRGPDAAALTALARHTLKAASINEQDPAAILRVLNDAILSSVDDGRFCTVAYCVMHRDDGRWRATLTLGGHPQLRLLRGDTVQSVGHPGALIGVFASPRLERTEFELEPGDQLVAFTDGLIEQHDPPFDERDLDVLLEHCAGAGAGLEEVIRAIESHVSAEAVREDDTAVLAIEIL